MRFASHDRFVYTKTAFDHTYLQVSLLCLPTGNQDKLKSINISQLIYVFGHLCWLTLTLVFNLLDFATIYLILTESEKCGNISSLPPPITLLRFIYSFSFLFFIPYFSPDYRYQKDEIFKRLKVSTFAQLVSMKVHFFAVKF